MPPHFPDIDPIAWEHPADRAALDALRSVPGFDAVLRATLGRLQDAVALRSHLADASPAAEEAPHVHRTWQEVLGVLDAPDPVPLYVRDGDSINGYTFGVRRPHVMVTQAAIERLTVPQLRAILAHELGHVMSGHITYKTIIRALEATRWWLLPGGTNLVLTAPLLLALYAWDRKSELSADRAELLVVQDLDVSVRLLRLTHAPIIEQVQERYRRIAEVSRAGAQAIEALEQAFSKHPPLDERIAELEAWHTSDRYRAILAGDYPRRDPDALRPAAVEERLDTVRSGFEEQVAAARQAGARLRSQASSWLSDLGEAAGSQAGSLLERFRPGGGAGDEE
ncbi:MAG: M48 family peptidase [Deltaproteobacteria bacterium]|nr:MAG: M48 family peptidase [Deltaproteobacteria bacterium]